uniref:Peptidase S1 domain-containing protein n=1 Tax=Anopheles epiroticus TaxID=199890 RepID=A0A182PRS8_9DIPT
MGEIALTDEEVWLQYNRRMPGEFYTKGAPYRAPYHGRIVGGVEADIANYPYQLSLRRTSHSCGASVISARWALSAAHCTFPLPAPTAITLQGGSSDRTSGGVVFNVDQIINHPNYDDWNLRNDVCVLRSTTDLSGVNIAPIALDPVGATHAPGSRAVLSGWGLMEGNVLPVMLRRIDIPIVDQATCVSQWNPGWVTDDMICASEPGRDACNGDSGGPLVVAGRQLGIVSWGDTQCVGTSPGVFARVAFPLIRNWISETTGMKQLLCLTLLFASVLAGFEEDQWQQYNRHMPGAYHSLGLPEQPPFLGRVVGGVDANIADYPYMLSLRRNNGHFCGASIIATRWALSAAHCTFPLPAPSAVQLLGGTSSRTSGGVMFDVAEIINHPDYNDWTVEFDVCVLRTVVDLSGVNIAPVALDPSGATHAPGSRAVLSGWGRNGAGVLPEILQRVDIPVVSDAECAAGWPGFITPDGAVMNVVVVICAVALAVVSGQDASSKLYERRMLPAGAQLIDDRAPSMGFVGSLKKIIGGEPVSIETHPYQLSLRNYDYHICGASIISSVWALTAAHCLYPDPEPRTISLTAGTDNQQIGGRIYNATRIIIHPMYDPSTMDNDVAVIRVNTHFSGPNTGYIGLVPLGYEPIAGMRAIVTGWGRQSDGGKQSTTLAGVEIPIVDKEECMNQWTGVLVSAKCVYRDKASTPEVMICAGEFGKDSCNGDSGGPLVSGGRQIGIVSWGSTKCGGPLAAIYTNIGNAAIRTFISSTTGI